MWLMVGPDSAHSGAFLRNVVSITTDQGTERLLADLLLPAFYKYIGAALPKEVEFGKRLLLHCLVLRGWNHICDGLTQTRSNSLRWFLRWLDLLKSLNRVLRDDIKDLERNGLGGAATLVADSSHPFFAMWRWHTLAACCASIGKVLPTLQWSVHLPVSLSRARDKSSHEKALEATGDAKWESMFRCVGPYAAWVVKL